MPAKPRFLPRAEVLRLTTLSSSALDRLIGAGRFPRPVNLTGRADATRGRHSTAWIEAEVVAWQTSRIASRPAAYRAAPAALKAGG